MMNSKLRILVFNEDIQVLCAIDGLLLVDHENYNDGAWDREVYTKVKEKYGLDVGVGDVVHMSDEDGCACLGFIDKSTIPDGYSFRPLSDVLVEAGDVQVFAALHRDLMNATVMRPGHCYMNTKTDECYHVITILNDSKGAKLYVLECNLMTLPVVLPSTTFIGLHMIWIPHVKYAQMCIEPDELVDKAKRFFIKAHNDTLHFYDGKPYSFHTSGVVDVFKKYKHLVPVEDHVLVESVLWGHDSVEDARLTYNNVKTATNKDIAEGTFAMTNEKGRARKDRANSKYYDGLDEWIYGEFAKLCDRIFNMSNSISTGHGMADGYKEELEKFELELRRNGDTYKEMWDDLKALANGVQEVTS